MAEQPQARYGLALLRLAIGAQFVWVFFENLGKGLYKPAAYAGLIRYYIEKDTAPAIWKSVMAVAANHASMAAPLQGMTEITVGVLLVPVLASLALGIGGAGRTWGVDSFLARRKPDSLLW